MITPKELSEAARDYAWSYYNKGVMLAVTMTHER